MDIDVPSSRERDAEAGRSRESAGRGRLGRLRARVGAGVGGIFAVRSFVLAMVGSALGLFAGNLSPLPLGGFGSVLGVLAASFLGGLVLKRAYIEWMLAGALVSALSVLLGYAFLSMAAGIGVNIAAIGGAAGGSAGVIGHYFGRDLRAGLTKSIE
jgi:hypothetical protein